MFIHCSKRCSRSNFIPRQIIDKLAVFQVRTSSFIALGPDFAAQQKCDLYSNLNFQEEIVYLHFHRFASLIRFHRIAVTFHSKFNFPIKKCDFYSKFNFPSKKCDLNSKFNFPGGIVEGARPRDKWTDRDRRNHSL